jgi:ParB-like chromosome segregation protein Spo0J
LEEQKMNTSRTEMPNSNVERPASHAGGGPAPHIEMMQLGRLTPYEGNARTHSKAQIRQIAQSIQRFGHTNPILIDDGGQIIAGHGRVEAAKLLGIESVPALRLSHLSAADKRAYVIADNRLAEKAGWDRELLAIELQALVDLEFDVELTGFEMGEIDIILSDSDEAKDEAAGPEDDAPDPLPDRIVSRLGDIWNLGQTPPSLRRCTRPRRLRATAHRR